MAERKKKKSASLGCLFWIAFILLIIVLFFFNKKTISGVLDKTGATAFFSGHKNTVQMNGPETVSPAPRTDNPEQPTAIPGSGTITGDGSGDAGNQAKTTTPAPLTKTDNQQTITDTGKNTPAGGTATKPVEKPNTGPVTNANPATVSGVKNSVAKTGPQKTVQTRKATLYFVTIDADGQVLRKEVVREIPRTDSPLSETLASLFRGTSSTEAAKGLRSLVPPGTRILSAIVKNGVATLNLSDDFQFNQFGIEGYLGQLSQIVFTATSFSTVQSVQILIDGQKKEYLGAEGVWIGTPLTRDNF
jgi:spore germination protein GerM